MIAWVDEACRSWGAHKRWVLSAPDQGWPERSILGRLIDEGPGAGHETFGSRVPVRDPPEPYVLVSVALQRMAATHELGMPIQVIEAHYLWDGRAKQKAPKLGVSVKQYWNMLHTAHAFIAGMAVPRETDAA
jgi:hypothetical protein